MLSSFSEKVMQTKIKAMYGKNLTAEDYDALLHKQTVAEVAAYLKSSTHYGSVLAQVQENMIHRGQLEQLINQECYLRYERLLTYCRAGFYRFVFYSLEIREIVGCLQQLRSGRKDTYISELPAYLQRRLQVEMLKMAKASTVEELLEVLEKTPYHRLLKPHLSVPAEQVDIPACEKALNSFYYRKVEELIDKNYKGKKAKELKLLFDTQRELHSITQIYRLKKFFSMAPEEIQRILLPGKNRIPPKMWKALLQAPTAENFLEQLSRSPYAKYMDEDFQLIEYTAHTIAYSIGRRYLNYSTHTPAVFAAFMVLMDIERENMIHIIEGIRYQLSPEDIEKMLVL